jgi:phytoene dehydrogenase-like protein
VLVIEAKETIGGGSRSAELTLPGYVHDVCSAIHSLGVGSPFFRALPLDEHGLEWIHPQVPLAHPLDDGTAAVLHRSVRATAKTLGRDASVYRKLMVPLACDWVCILDALLGPLRPLRISRHPLALARFGLGAIQPARAFAERRFQGQQARALFGGMAAHSMLALEQPPSAAAGLMLGLLGHAVGWPVARGGSQKVADAMSSYLRSLGGEIITDRPVASLDELPQARAVLFDVTPRQLLSIAGDHLPEGYKRQLRRYRYGPGVFKVDLALDGPIPWKAQECLGAGTVHVGGTLREIAAAERAVTRGRHPARPFVLVAQQSLFDPTRAPQGKHTVWAYCHVPNGSKVDMTERIEVQIERFAPGFRDRIIGRNVMSPAQMEQYNPNYVGGDINGGVQDLLQLFTRPAPRLSPYSTPARGIYICSSSTPPGGGVHGMCGYFAAQAALKRMS